MIPSFPNFKKLEISDRASVEHYLHRFPPYSDFNFTNLWAWDVHGTREISILYDNLVVLFTDYRIATPHLSFIGTNSANQTAEALLHHATQRQILPLLKFIPEEVALQLTSKNITISEDPANHDYIFSISQIAEPKGRPLKIKRHLANRFIAENPLATCVHTDLSNPITHDEIVLILYCWEKNKKNCNKASDITFEEIALQRVLNTVKNHDLFLSYITINGVMVAFSIDELLPNKHVISHFIKADITYKGIYEYMNQCTAAFLHQQGYEFWNWEQDLNLEGLRQLKLSYRPTHFIKKFIIEFSKNSV